MKLHFKPALFFFLMVLIVGGFARAEDRAADVWLGVWNIRYDWAHTDYANDGFFEILRNNDEYSIDIKSPNKVTITEISEYNFTYSIFSQYESKIHLTRVGTNRFKGKLTVLTTRLGATVEGERLASPATPPRSLSNEHLDKEIETTGTGISEFVDDIEKVINSATYSGVDIESIRKKNNAKIAVKQQEIELEKEKIRADFNKYCDALKLPSPCDSAGTAARFALREEVGFYEKIARLDEILQAFKDELSDGLLFKYGDKAARDNVLRLRAGIRLLRKRQSKLKMEKRRRELEQIKRQKAASEERNRLHALEEDVPLVPAEEDWDDQR